MARTLVTGATGFVGLHLVRALADRGDDVRVLVREASSMEALADLGVERAIGDVTDRESVRRAFEGVDRVFHAAGRTSLRSRDRDAVFAVNVHGTGIVLSEALAAGVERAVHTSSVSAIGAAPPHGRVDESHPFAVGHLGIAYVNSKHEAEMEALRLAAQGLPVTIVNPTFVLGPESPGGSSMQLVRRFLLGRIPAYVDGGLNVVDVRDVAAGHLLAERHGRAGERYILGGRNFTLRRLFAELGRISGVEPPALRLPAAPTYAATAAAERLGLPVPVMPEEVRSGAMWWTCTSEKARRELGFDPRPHEETLTDAVEWQLAQLGDRTGGGGLRGAVESTMAGALRTAGRLIAR